MSHHHSYELLIVNVTISIQVGLFNHFVHFLVCEFFAQICHYVSELCGRYKSVTVSIENPKSLN